MADLCDCAYDPLLEPAPENPCVATGFYIFTALLLCLIVQAHGCWRIYRNHQNRGPITVFAFQDGNVHVTFPFENEAPAVIPLRDDNLQLATPLDE